ncbi:TetR/AcrR family transcriptional regulator [Mesorhizobium sp. 1B3]|uniref:TetR/AcrR family transcriptional regulator n=1 Tax=Mesorhizobium sp. 1B3 TaxID=3243599 RepID=UPI003D98EC6B
MARTHAEPEKNYEGNVKATRYDWLAVALETLITEGVDQVKVLPLGNKLGVSRSSFYWYFQDRKQLLDTLLDYWESKNTRNLIIHCEMPSATITEAALNIAECWLDDDLFDPRLDFAVREWSRRDGGVRKILDAADAARVEAMRLVFRRHGYEEVEAYIRARVFYFTQIGYYALDLKEHLADRLSYLHAYMKTATGYDPEPDIIERFRDKHRLYRANGA